MFFLDRVPCVVRRHFRVTSLRTYIIPARREKHFVAGDDNTVARSLQRARAANTERNKYRRNQKTSVYQIPRTSFKRYIGTRKHQTKEQSFIYI